MEQTQDSVYMSKSDLVYEVIKNLAIDETVPYCVLNAAIDGSIERNRTCLYVAMRRLGKEKKRTLKNIPNVGYRCVRAEEHEGIARGHHERARRQLRRTRETLESADRNQLSHEEAKRLDNLTMTVRSQQAAIHRLEERQARQEKTLRLVARKTTVTDTNVSVLEKKVMDQAAEMQSIKETLGTLISEKKAA